MSSNGVLLLNRLIKLRWRLESLCVMMEERFCRFWNQPYGSQIQILCWRWTFGWHGNWKDSVPWEEKNSSLLQSSGRTRMEGEHIGGRWTVMFSPADKDVCDYSWPSQVSLWSWITAFPVCACVCIWVCVCVTCIIEFLKFTFAQVIFDLVALNRVSVQVEITQTNAEFIRGLGLG